MKPLALAIALLLSSIALAQQGAGPELGIPPELRPTGQYVALKPKTEAKAITYIGIPSLVTGADGKPRLITIDPIPADFLADPRWFLLDTRGLMEGLYLFDAVGSLDDVHTRVRFVVVIGNVPDPDKPDTPVPPTLDELGKKSFAAANTLPSIARSKCKDVAAVYRDVIKRAEAVESGYATVTEVQNKLSAARAEAQGDPASWGAWNTAIKAEWDRLWQQSAGQVTKTQVLQFHKSVASGLEAVK